MKHFALPLLVLLALARPVHPCSICGVDFQNRPTLRQETTAARVVVYGTLSNARLNADAANGDGRTDLKVEQVIRGGDLVTGGATLTLPRYYPGDGKAAQRG